MPRLLAYVPRDAWAFVQDGDLILCVYPPFLTSSRRVVTPTAVSEGTSLHGYVAVDAPDEPWPEVIARIRREAHRESPPTDAHAFSEQALAHLPAASLERIVQRLEVHALDSCESEEARRALERVIEHHRVRTDERLHSIVRDALHRVRDGIECQQRARAEAVLPERIRAQRNDPAQQRRRAAILHGRASLAA